MAAVKPAVRMSLTGVEQRSERRHVKHIVALRIELDTVPCDEQEGFRGGGAADDRAQVCEHLAQVAACSRIGQLGPEQTDQRLACVWTTSLDSQVCQERTPLLVGKTMENLSVEGCLQAAKERNRQS